MVVRTDRHLDSRRKQGARGVCSEIVHVSKEFVAYGTNFYTDVVVFDQLGQVRVHAQVESVANAFGAK